MSNGFISNNMHIVKKNKTKIKKLSGIFFLWIKYLDYIRTVYIAKKITNPSEGSEMIKMLFENLICNPHFFF